MLSDETLGFFQVEKVLHYKSHRPILGKSPIFLISGLPKAAWMSSIGILLTLIACNSGNNRDPTKMFLFSHCGIIDCFLKNHQNRRRAPKVKFYYIFQHTYTVYMKE